MPNRIIKESIKRSPEIDRLTWFEEVMFYRLIVTADDYGRLDGRPIVLRNDLFPTKDTVTRKAVEDAISKLASVGLLIPYVDAASGMSYLQIAKWDRHQNIRNKYSKYPAPTEEQLRANAVNRQLHADCNQLQTDCNQVLANCRIESESESESESYQQQQDAHAREEVVDDPRQVDMDSDWVTFVKDYEQNIGAMPASGHALERLQSDYEILGADVIREAIRVTALAYADNPARYFSAICADWIKREIRTVDAARTDTANHQRKAAKDKGAANPALEYDQRQYTDDDYAGLFINLSE